MESPLDVLTRAASMIEANQIHQINGDLKRSMDLRQSPPKELPSKMLKYKRMKERQQMLAAESGENDVNKKCAGTQTYSSFERSTHSPDRPHSEPAVSSYHILDLDSRHTSAMSSGVPGMPHHLSAVPRVPSPAHITPRSRASPPAPEHESMDTDSHPLNLSVTSNSQNSRIQATSSSHHPHSMTSSTLPSSHLRPSVITIAPTTTLTNHNNNRVGSGYSGYPHHSFLGQSGSDHRPPHLAPTQPRQDTQQDDVCDPAIEEHFRRSLGAHYPNFMTKDMTSTHPLPESSAPPSYVASPASKSSSTSPPLASHRVQSSSVSPSSLSPHSARWSSPSPPSSSTSHSYTASTSRSDSEKAVSVTGSVDDHFARALGGDTWNQIKSRKEAVNMDIYTGSVDDHFAKALGDTWYKIKAEREGSRSPEGSSRSNSSSPVPPPPRSSSRSPSSQTSIRYT